MGTQDEALAMICTITGRECRCTEESVCPASPSTRDIALELLDQIKEAAADCDSEMAHKFRDELWELTLRFIAPSLEGEAKDAVDLALKANEIPFARWYA